MPRVLRIINRLNLGGPTFNAAYLTKYLAPEFETLLLAGMRDPSEGSSEFIVEGSGIEPQFIQNMHRSLHPVKDYKAYKEIKKIIKEFKPDIVHTHAAKPGAVGRLAAHHCKVPVIVHTFHGHVFHSYFGKAKTQVFLNIERAMARRSSKIVAISNLQKRELVEDFKICPSDKMTVVPLGFELDRFHQNQDAKRKQFREKWKLQEGELAIGIIGRLVPVKNHPLFLRAFSKVNMGTHKKLKAVVIGDGEDMESLQTLCKELDLDYSTPDSLKVDCDVVFTSWEKDVDVALAGLDIVSLSSFNEGTPVSLIEAQAAGRPIVSTEVGGIRDVVAADRNALLSASEDLNSFAQNLGKLVEDDQLRASFSKVGQEEVLKKFSVQRLASDMGSLYRELLQESKQHKG